MKSRTRRSLLIIGLALGMLVSLPALADEAPTTPAVAPPNPPSNIQFSNVLDNRVTVTWDDNSDDETGFDVMRSSNRNGPFQRVVRVSQPRYPDVGLLPNTQYCYRIDAVNNDGVSSSDIECVQTLPARPQAPVLQSVLQVGESPTLEIQWRHEGSSDSLWFNVYRTRPNTTLLGTLGDQTFSLIDFGLDNGVQYCYQVAAQNSTAESLRSAEVCGSVTFTAAQLPANITATPQSPTEILLEWDLPVYNYAELIIERGPDEAGPFTEIVRFQEDLLEISDATVFQNQRYCYRFIASNALGDSDPSAPVCVQTSLGKPNTPQVLDITDIDGTSLEITFDPFEAFPPEHRYRIERVGTDGALIAVVADSATIFSVIDSTLTELTAYCYRVQSYNSGFDSDFSDVVCGTTGLQTPTEVGNLVVLPDASDPTSILTASWEAATPTRFLNYEVDVRPADSAATDSTWRTLGPTPDLTLAVNSLDDAVLYDVRVRAVRTVDTLRASSDGTVLSVYTFMALWPGDTNDDGTVDAQDVVQMTQPEIFGQPTSATGDGLSVAWQQYDLSVDDTNPRILRSDTDRNGVVDVFDFLAIAANTGRQVPGAPASTTSPSLSALPQGVQRETVLALYNRFTPDLGQPAHDQLQRDLATLLGFSADVPATVTLAPNYPNPFNPTTTFTFGLPETEAVTLKVFNALGQTVATVVDETLPAGTHTRTFSALNLPSGQYFFVLRVGTTVETRTMTLLK